MKIELTTDEEDRLFKEIRYSTQDARPVIESIIAARIAEALRDASALPAAMRVNREGSARGRNWLWDLANQYDPTKAST